MHDAVATLLNDLADNIERYENAEKTLQKLVECGIVTAAEFQHRVFASESKNLERQLRNFMYCTQHTDDFARKVVYLADNRLISSYAFWHHVADEESDDLLLDSKIPFDKWLKLITDGIVCPERTNRISGALDSVEADALQRDIRGSSRHSKYYPFDQTAHPLLQKMRGQEHIAQLSEQVRRVIDDAADGHIMEQFGQIFDHYLATTEQYKILKKRERIPAGERAIERIHNIKIVNAAQERALSDYPAYEKDKRYIDLYIRYGTYGFMDPFQMAVISRAVEWYVFGGHSRLFNGVRIIPYHSHDAEGDSMPHLPVAACRGSQFLNATGKRFLESLMGANRFFLTHSQSFDATHMASIPIVGTATAGNSQKSINDLSQIVVFRADFDPKDPFRGKNRTHLGGLQQQGLLSQWIGLARNDEKQVDLSEVDVAGDIAGLINETLRTLTEVEEKEIKRAEKSH